MFANGKRPRRECLASLRQGVPAPERAELLVAAREPLGRGERGGLPQALPQRRVEQACGLVVVVLRAARGLRDDQVDDAGAVRRRNSAARGACALSLNRIAAQPSGVMTE